MTTFDNAFITALVTVVALFIGACLSEQQDAKNGKEKKRKVKMAILLSLVLMGSLIVLAFVFRLESKILGIPREETEPPAPPTEETSVSTTGPMETTQEETTVPTTLPAENPFAGVAVGDTICFGHYEQDNQGTTNQEPIEWIVLEINEDKALLLSVYGMDCQPYNGTNSSCTWATCSLRKWLNESFYRVVFSQEEKEYIVKSTVPAHRNARFGTNPGAATEDNVFLLSAEEAELYLLTTSGKMCTPTEYAVSRGAYVNPTYKTCWWWLRTPGESAFDACSVNSDGTMDYDDGSVNSNKGCVRPAIRISIG